MLPFLDSDRRSGANLPFGRPENAHGVAMEGYFWRFTHAETNRAVIALIGVQQTDAGTWALCGLGGSDGFWRDAVVEGAAARRVGLGPKRRRAGGQWADSQGGSIAGGGVRRSHCCHHSLAPSGRGVVWAARTASRNSTLALRSTM